MMKVFSSLFGLGDFFRFSASKTPLPLKYSVNFWDSQSKNTTAVHLSEKPFDLVDHLLEQES
jgi:hypothetical protein